MFCDMIFKKKPNKELDCPNALEILFFYKSND